MEIVNYKAWTYKSYQKAYNVRYVNIVNKLEKGATTLRTSIGFAPLLIRFLRIKGFDASGEEFRAREATFPAMQLSLYDFQERMVADWLRAGGIGVIKAPTGSGKCCKGNTLILTDKGLIKIEDIVRGISDSKNKDVSQTSLYDNFSEYGEKFVDNDNIKNLDKIISVSPKLRYDKYNISKKYDMGINDIVTLTTSIGFEISGTGEHKIIVINKDGNLVFKKLEEISTDDHVAISYNTNVFNDKLRLNYYYRISSKNIKNILQNIEYMNEDIATLLGYAVAEGYDFLSEDKGIGHLSITNYDEELVDNTIRICKNLGINAERSYYQGKLTGVNVSSVEIIDFIHYLGCRHGAKNKDIPWSILQADKRSQIVFIRALFDCDGTVYQGETDKDTEKTKELVEYYSSSYELCRQLQILLINMGIISRLSTKKGATLEYRGELRTYEKSYRLSITGGEILKFSDIISFGLSRKKEILDRCVSALNNRSRWTDITYPNICKKLNVLYERLKLLGKKGDIVHTWEEDYVVGNKTIKITRKKKMSSREYLRYNKFEKPIWAYVTGERCPSKETLEKILAILEPTRDMPEYQYLKLLSKRFIFDKVEDIKEEKDHVYDITIDNIHSYIGNGIINHNTIIGGKAIEEIGRKTLILVHTSDLLVNVWIDSLIKSFGPGITYQVGIVGGGVTDKDRAAMRIGTRTGGFDANMRKDIVIATFQTLINHLDELRNYKFGLMIVDECIPIDSKIWTQDGVIKYEDLGYGREYKSDVFQVWSNDKNDNIVNNGYKKVKTRMKHMYMTTVETGDELVCSLDHKVLTRKDDGKEEFIEIDKAKNIGLSLVKPGYRYDENEKREEITRLFLKYIDRCNKERQELNNMVTNLWNNKIISRRDITDITADSSAGVIHFNEWNDKVSGDIIFLDILKHEYRGYEQGYTLTVNNDHNYLVNGFVVRNCHHAPAQMFRKVNSVIKAPYKLGLSATVRRLDGMEKDIFGALGDIQSKVSIRELINKGILAEPRFQSPVIVDQEVMAAIETCGLGGLNLSRFVKKASASSQKKLDYIINICKNIAARGRTFLLFTDYVRAEDVFVRDMYAERLIQEGLSISIVDQGMSSDERSKVFSYLETGKISGIIFGKLGSEGVNIPSVNVVVMANGIKSPITFCQRVGRVMRKVPGKDFCDVYEVLIDIPMEHRWSDFNFAEYRAEGFQKTVYKVE